MAKLVYQRPISFNEKNFKCLKNVAANRTGVSQQKRGKQFGVPIHYHLKKVSLKYYKRQKASKYDEKR